MSKPKDPLVKAMAKINAALRALPRDDRPRALELARQWLKTNPYYEAQVVRSAKLSRQPAAPKEGSGDALGSALGFTHLPHDSGRSL